MKVVKQVRNRMQRAVLKKAEAILGHAFVVYITPIVCTVVVKCGALIKLHPRYNYVKILSVCLLILL